MRKYFGFVCAMLCFTLAGCSGTIKNENGSENLVRFDSVPEKCQQLYTINTDISVYKEEDAIRYLENQIVANAKGGNAYMITQKNTRKNDGAVFGPKETFILKANVYVCPGL